MYQSAEIFDEPLSAADDFKTAIPTGWVQAVAFSPDNKLLMTGGRDKPMIDEFLRTIFGDSKFNPGVSARLWDVETGNLIHTFTKHRNDVMDVAYSHNGNWVATASADKTAEISKVNK